MRIQNAPLKTGTLTFLDSVSRCVCDDCDVSSIAHSAARRVNMHLRLVIAGLLLVANATGAPAQYVRPVEVPIARPVTPMSAPITPQPNPLSPMPLQPAPTLATPPAVMVPIPPPIVNQAGKARPRRCWCFVRNPVNNATTRTACEVECCKGDKQDQRC